MSSGSPALQAFVSSSAAERLAHAHAWVRERRHEAPTRPLLVLADRLATSTEVVHPLLLDDADDAPKAIFGVYRSTLDLLAAELAGPTLIDHQLAFAGGAAHQAIVIRVLHEVEGQLTRFAAVALTPGFARVLARTLDELALHRVTPDELRAQPDGAEHALLLECYQRQLRAEQLVDRAGLLDAAARSVEAAERHPLRGGAALLVDVELQAPAEVAFLRALSALELDLSAVLPRGDGPARVALEQIAAPGALHVVTRAPSGSSALTRLQRHLFGDAPPPEQQAEQTRGVEASLEIFSGPTPQAECVEIARRALALVDQGLRAEQIAVVVRQATPYVELLTEAFSRAGLSVFAAEGAYLPDPAGRAFLALLRCALDDLPATLFAEYLSLGQVPGAIIEDPTDPNAEGEADGDEDDWDDEEWQDDDWDAWDELDDQELARRRRAARLADNPPLPGRWEQLIGDAKVGLHGGLARWRSRLSALEVELELLAEEAAREDESESEASPRSAALLRDRQQLRRLRDFALPLLERLEELRRVDRDGGEAPSWSAWLALLAPLAEQALARPARVLELLEHLRPLEGTGAVPLARVVETLGDRLRDLRRAPPRQRAGRVYLGLAEEVRGRVFEAVFVAGLAERTFPAKVLQNPVLLDELRARITAAREDHLRAELAGGDGGVAAPLPALPRAAQRRARERLYLQLAVGAARRFVGLSYPRMELSPPQPRVPSFYLLEASRAVEGRLPDFEQLIAEASERGAVRLERPFPPRPEQAVDEQEYDLALLGEAARTRRESPREQLAGFAGHLHEHPLLVPALRAHWRRGGKGLSVADGLVGSQPSTAALLAEHSLRARAYGVTALERYARCPYQLYLHSVLRLRPPTSLEVEGDGVLDAKTRGSFFHRVQFEVGRELAQGGLAPLTAEALPEARRSLSARVAAVAEELRQDLAPPVEVLWQQEVAQLSAELSSWLRREARPQQQSFTPLRFELAFGVPDRGGYRGRTPRDVASTDEPVELEGGYLLRGSIDLVERSEAGLRVTDYKTGAAPQTAQISPFEGGRGLQRVLYGLCLEALDPQQPVVSGRLYFCTERGGYRELEQPLSPVVRSQALDILRAIDDALCAALLPALPLDDETCARCDYQRVCGGGAAARAMQKRDDPRLSKLRLLREL
jgi:ATP-dependent helicase/nuclease subunit B